MLFIQYPRIKTCVLKKTRTWMPIEEDVELKRKRTPHRDKLLRRERKADEKRTIRGTTIERETFREDHNIGGSRQRFEMPFQGYRIKILDIRMKTCSPRDQTTQQIMLFIQYPRIKTCVLKKTRTWMPIEEDVELKRKRTPHRDKLLRRERKADEKRTIRGLSNDGQSLGSEISANLHMRAKRKPAHKKMKADSKILVCIFARKFRALAEILGLMRSDGIEIQRCYLDYLEALVSHYKAARSSRKS
ncbi:hypothetical protein Tco_0257769, partial [Tanacetum coccineum]